MNLSLKLGSCNFLLCRLQLNVHEKMKARLECSDVVMSVPVFGKLLSYNERLDRHHDTNVRWVFLAFYGVFFS
jgi:hypothetical protein